jgi:dihydrofolate reductase
MRKIIESTFMTLGGVIGDTVPSTAPGANPGVWGQPFWDDEHAGYAQKLMARADALLLGRTTYEGFAQAWPQRSGDPFTDKINAMPKYVASRTLQSATWNATIIKGDVAEEVSKLKQQPGEDILKYGTGELDQTLMEHRLVDEFHFWLFPISLGSGKRLFEGFDTRLKLVDTNRFKSGIVVLVYEPTPP